MIKLFVYLHVNVRYERSRQSSSLSTRAKCVLNIVFLYKIKVTFNYLNYFDEL